jgi:hypothetical protein
MSGTGKTTIELPPGCYGVQDSVTGLEFNGKPGGKVDVPDELVPAIQNSSAGRSGTLTTTRSYQIGTKRGRVCTDNGCGFLAQAWSEKCPRCKSPTREE